MATIKPLEWEALDPHSCWRAAMPLFGSVRVENYLGDYWIATWSVPGYSDTFAPGLFGDKEEAKAAVQEKYDRLMLAALDLTKPK